MTRALLILSFACSGGELPLDPPDSDTVTDTADTDLQPPRDVDSDGFTDDVDCDDFDPAVNPNATEEWDGEDNDCDGRVDGDGRYEGAASVAFAVVYEGQSRRWTLDCPVVVDRTNTSIALEVTCSPPDALAEQLLGVVTISEIDNVAVQGSWSGRTDWASSNGWSAGGNGYLTWISLDRVTGGVGLATTFLDAGGTLEGEFGD